MIEDEIAQLLKERGLTISVAEACTSGIIAARLTSVSGSSLFFVGGVLAYANEVKEKILGLPKELMIKEGSVSEATARAMARGVKELLDSDLAISATGVMGPTGGTVAKPVGLFFVAVAGDDIDLCARHMFTGDRANNRDQASTAALELLRDALLAREPGPPS